MGIPISLSVLFATICRRVGVQLDMIGLPGHFLLATRAEEGGLPYCAPHEDTGLQI